MKESDDHAADSTTPEPNMDAIEYELFHATMRAQGVRLPMETRRQRVDRLIRHNLIFARVTRGDEILDEEGRANYSELQEQLITNLIAAYEALLNTHERHH